MAKIIEMWLMKRWACGAVEEVAHHRAADDHPGAGDEALGAAGARAGAACSVPARTGRW